MLFLPLPGLLLAATLASIVLSAPRVSHDCALYLQAAALLLDGNRPYVDFVDLNPPLIVYFNTIPVALARLIGVHLIKAFAVVVWILAAWSTLTTWRTVARLRHPDAAPTAGLLATTIAGLTAYLWGAEDYGQREHLIVLLYVPYLCARVAGGTEASRGGGAFLRGLAAGVAVCLKPQYAALALLVEGYAMLVRGDERRLVRHDVAGLVCAGVAYVVHFALLPVDVREALFQRWLPLVRSGYAAYDEPITLDVRSTATVVVAVVALLLRLRWRGAVAALAAGLALATLVSIAIFFLQHKGWHYHLIPAIGFRTALVACLVVGGFRAVQTLAAPRLRWMVSAGGATVAWGTVAFVMSAIQPMLAYPEFVLPLRDFVQRYTRAGDRVLVLSTSVVPAYPLLTEEDRLPGSRFLWLFPIPMLYRGVEPTGQGTFPYHDRSTIPPEERRFLDELKEDIARNPPALVVVPLWPGCQGCPPSFHLGDYLRGAGVLSSLSGYLHVGSVAGFGVFARKPA